MASFSRVVSMNYTIIFVDEALYTFAAELTTSNACIMAPDDAAVMFGIPIPYPGGGAITENTIAFLNYVEGQEVGNGWNNGTVVHTGVFINNQVTTYTVPDWGWKGTPHQSESTYQWVFSVKLIRPADESPDPAEVAPIPPRRWAMGWEGYASAECHPQASTGARARDASRIVDGFGLKIRAGDGGPNMECILSNSDGMNLPSRNSWERFYIRVRQYGAAVGDIWKATGTVSTSSGVRLQIQTTGEVQAIQVNSGGVNTDVFGTTHVLELNTWYRFDILLAFAPMIGFSGRIIVYVNGILQIDGDSTTSGIGTVQYHRGSIVLGNFSGSSTWEIDMDDWHNAELFDLSLTVPLDWWIGTHTRATFVSRTGTTTGWTGAGIPILDQYVDPPGSAVSLSATAALATLNIGTLATNGMTLDDQIYPGGLTHGPACATVSVSGTQTGGNSGRVGYSIAGAPAAMSATIALPLGALPIVYTYTGTGTDLTPAEIVPMNQIYEKGPVVSATTMSSMMTAVQYIGVWGTEDYFGMEPLGMELLYPILHNCRYPSYYLSQNGPPTDAPVCVATGTYTGNSTFQDIQLCWPAHLIVIRNTTTAITPLMVLSTSFAPVAGGTGESKAADIVKMWIDEFGIIGDVGIPYFTVSGVSNRCNLLANNYQWFAFCDPGMVYMLNGEINHGNSTNTFINPLIDGSFTPEFGILMFGPDLGAATLFKSGLSPGTDAVTLAGGNTASVMSFGTGTLTTLGGASETFNCTAYCMIRTTMPDAQAFVMAQITTYTGNGLTSQIIPLVPACGRFPAAVFAYRRGGSSVVFYRDASHAGANSCNLGTGANSTTAITAGGIDTITVGSALNVNGATYDVLVFPGDNVSWLNNVCICAPPSSTPGDFWNPPEEPPPGILGVFEGGLILGDTASLTLLKDLSGIYTLVPGKHDDTLYDRQTGQPSIDMAIPNPNFKTGYIGG
jgi:hypothetical protein